MKGYLDTAVYRRPIAILLDLAKSGTSVGKPIGIRPPAGTIGVVFILDKPPAGVDVATEVEIAEDSGNAEGTDNAGG